MKTNWIEISLNDSIYRSHSIKINIYVSQNVPPHSADCSVLLFICIRVLSAVCVAETKLRTSERTHTDSASEKSDKLICGLRHHKKRCSERISSRTYNISIHISASARTDTHRRSHQALDRYRCAQLWPSIEAREGRKSKICAREKCWMLNAALQRVVMLLSVYVLMKGILIGCETSKVLHPCARVYCTWAIDLQILAVSSKPKCRNMQITWANVSAGWPLKIVKCFPFFLLDTNVMREQQQPKKPKKKKIYI